MTIQRMIELLEIEHECMLRNLHDDCDRNCADCDLVQDDGDLHEMYTDVIALLKEHETIVRCKDCENGAYVAAPGMLPFVKCGGIDHELDWFCADGRKKEDVQLLEYADQDTTYYANQEVLRPLT